MAEDGSDTVGGRPGGRVTGSSRRDRFWEALPHRKGLLLAIGISVVLILAGPWLVVVLVLAVIGNGPTYPPAPTDRLDLLPLPVGGRVIGTSTDVVDSNDGMYPSSGAIAVRAVELHAQFIPAVEATRAAAMSAGGRWRESRSAPIGHCFLDEIDGDALVLVIVPGDSNPALGEPARVITAVVRWSDAAGEDAQYLCEGTAMAVDEE